MKKKLIIGGLAVGLAALLSVVSREPEKLAEPESEIIGTRKSVYGVYGARAVILGSYPFDLDKQEHVGEVTRPISASRYSKGRLKDLVFGDSGDRLYDVLDRFVHSEVEYGAQEHEADLQIVHHDIGSNAQKELISFNGNLFARLGFIDMEKVTLDELKNADYSHSQIPGDWLRKGNLLAMFTNQANYALIRIDGWLPLEHRNHIERDTIEYDLVARLKLYPTDSSSKK
jgi:hypothetical protein